MEGSVFLAETANATAGCWYRVMDGSFRTVAGWPQGGRRGVGGTLDTVRSGRLLRQVGMVLIVPAQPAAPEYGSFDALQSLFEEQDGDGVFFKPPIDADGPAPAHLLGRLEQETLGPLWGGQGAYFIVPVQISIQN